MYPAMWPEPEIDDDKDIDPAYSMIDGEIPFGYEFVKKATMREINFGEESGSLPWETVCIGTGTLHKVPA